MIQTHRLSAESTAQLLEQLTVLRGILHTEPVNRLLDLIDAVAAKDTQDAQSCFYALTAALLSAEARRVTGDIWKDFLFSQLIEVPNRFSELAAQGVVDPPVQAAMERDLAL
jgi:hypothetical protein